MNGPLDDTSAATAVVTTDTSPKSSPRRPPPIKPDIPCYVPSTKDELFKTTEKICQRILTHRQNLSLSENEFQDLVLECTGSGAGSSPEAGNGSSYSTFLRFVTDLVEQLMADMFSTGSSKQESTNPPCMQLNNQFQPIVDYICSTVHHTNRTCRKASNPFFLS